MKPYVFGKILAFHTIEVLVAGHHSFSISDGNEEMCRSTVYVVQFNARPSHFFLQAMDCVARAWSKGFVLCTNEVPSK